MKLNYIIITKMKRKYDKILLTGNIHKVIQQVHKIRRKREKKLREGLRSE